MINEAFSAFISKLQTSFPKPEVQEIHLNWPGPKVKVNFPYLVVLTVSQEITNFTPKLVKKNTDNSFVYVTGEWTSRVDVHYLSRRGKADDQQQFIQKFTNLFEEGLIKDNGESQSPSLVLDFGAENPPAPYKKTTINFLSWQLDQQASNIQLGERRSIFELVMDVPKIVQTEPGYLIKDIDLLADISENAGKVRGQENDMPGRISVFSTGQLDTFPNIIGKRQLSNENNSKINAIETV